MGQLAKIYGRRPVEEAFMAGQRFEQLWIDERIGGEFLEEVQRWCGKANVAIKYVPRFQLDKLIDANHQGIIAEVALVDYASPQELMAAAEESGFLLILDGVTDVRNFGAIARSALAAGCKGIAIGQKQRAPVNAAAVKASAGALSRLPVARVGSLGSFVKLLRERNYVVVCIEGRGKRELESVDLLGQPVAFVMGSESEGISSAVRKAASTSVRLPQAVDFDSYNVAVAAGMACYEFLRQNTMQRYDPNAKSSGASAAGLDAGAEE